MVLRDVADAVTAPVPVPLPPLRVSKQERGGSGEFSSLSLSSKTTHTLANTYCLFLHPPPSFFPRQMFAGKAFGNDEEAQIGAARIRGLEESQQ